jgi:hypothetical protein
MVWDPIQSLEVLRLRRGVHGTPRRTISSAPPLRSTAYPLRLLQLAYDDLVKPSDRLLQSSAPTIMDSFRCSLN